MRSASLTPVSSPRSRKPPLEHAAIALQEIAWNGEVRRRAIDVETVALAQDLKKGRVGQNLLLTALAGFSDVAMHQILDDRIGQNERQGVAAASLPPFFRV